MRVEFFRTRPGGHRVVLAVGVCRIVYKERNGKTIPPADFFRSLGYAVDEGLVGHGVGASKTELLAHLHEPLPLTDGGHNLGAAHRAAPAARAAKADEK